MRHEPYSRSIARASSGRPSRRRRSTSRWTGLWSAERAYRGEAERRAERSPRTRSPPGRASLVVFQAPARSSKGRKNLPPPLRLDRIGFEMVENLEGPFSRLSVVAAAGINECEYRIGGSPAWKCLVGALDLTCKLSNRPFRRQVKEPQDRRLMLTVCSRCRSVGLVSGPVGMNGYQRISDPGLRERIGNDGFTERARTSPASARRHRDGRRRAIATRWSGNASQALR